MTSSHDDPGVRPTRTHSSLKIFGASFSENSAPVKTIYPSTHLNKMQLRKSNAPRNFRAYGVPLTTSPTDKDEKMNALLFKSKIKTGILMTSVLGSMAMSASAFEIVRDSAGVLAAGYDQYYVPNPIPPHQAMFTIVKHIPTNTMVCITGGYTLYCAGWVSGYTVTGNGYEVTKP